ncbi:MAG: hypothetical protein GTN93_10635 [Anaerolineae bacterium]|nr:hypothetical protein [Anaerolineae bacterium]
MSNLYRWTAEGEGIFAVGKRKIPKDLVPLFREQANWLFKPMLPPGDIEFLFTERGNRRYINSILPIHKKYLKKIKSKKIPRSMVKEILYEDQFQVAVPKRMVDTLDKALDEMSRRVRKNSGNVLNVIRHRLETEVKELEKMIRLYKAGKIDARELAQKQAMIWGAIDSMPNMVTLMFEISDQSAGQMPPWLRTLKRLSSRR